MDVSYIPWPDDGDMTPDGVGAAPMPHEAGGIGITPMPPVPLPPGAAPSMPAASASSEIPRMTMGLHSSSRAETTTREDGATLAQLAGVHDTDLDHDFAERARHGKPRLRFSGKHALIAVLAMVAVTCMSLTLLVTQSVNHAAMTAANASGGVDVTFRAIDGNGTADDAAGTEDGDGGSAGETTDETVQPQQGSTQDATEQPAQPPQDTRLDLNAATAEQLDAIGGIGPVTARKIIEYRERHGRFTSVDQLLDIPGIGTKTLEKIRPEVRV